MRDGALFFGIAQVGLALAFVAAAASGWKVLRNDTVEAGSVLAVVLAILWLVLSLAGGWKAWSARRMGLRTWISSILVASWFVLLVALLTFLFAILLPPMAPTTTFPLVSGPAALALALGLGWRLSGFRQTGRVSYRRRTAFCLPLAIVTMAVVLPTAGLAGLPYESSTTTIWPTRLPGVLRIPATEILLLTHHPDLSYRLHALGLVSSARMRRTALEGRDGIPVQYAWEWWARRAPKDALAAALAVPTTSSPTTMATPYDHMAGMVILRQGTPEHITERLRGNYSWCLQMAILQFLNRQDVVEACFDVFRQHFERGENLAWCHAMSRAPEKFKALMRRYAESGDEAQRVLLGRAFGGTAQGNDDLWRCAERVQVLTRCKPSTDMRRALLKSAEGQWSDHTPLERRLAAWHIRGLLGETHGEQPTADVLLTREEEIEQGELCRRARQIWGIPVYLW